MLMACAFDKYNDSHHAADNNVLLSRLQHRAPTPHYLATRRIRRKTVVSSHSNPSHKRRISLPSSSSLTVSRIHGEEHHASPSSRPEAVHGRAACSMGLHLDHPPHTVVEEIMARRRRPGQRHLPRRLRYHGITSCVAFLPSAECH